MRNLRQIRCRAGGFTLVNSPSEFWDHPVDCYPPVPLATQVEQRNFRTQQRLDRSRML